jgi:DUF4097 and DUF4098 domain-containing protein YvlB
VEELDLELDMGEARLSGIEAGKLECSTDMGAITVTGSRAAEADLSVNMCSLEIDAFTTDNCELSCDMGSISFKGSVGGLLDAECAMGSVAISLPRPSRYTVQAKAGMGGITVDGQDYGSGHAGGHHDNGNPSVPVDLAMELECGMGSIEVDFDYTAG